MSERLTNILGYLTLFAILGAIWVMFGEDPSKEQGARNDRTFAGAEAKVNETNEFSIMEAGTAVTLVRSTEGWVVKDRNAYKADAQKVRAFLKGIAKSERREPKTANKNRFDVLGLGQQAANITLVSESGKKLLSFLAGKRRENPVSGRSLTYIYQDTDTRSWLVSELATIEPNPAWWLEKTLFSFDESRISDVTINGVWLTRKFGKQDFKLQGVKASEQVVSSWQLKAPAELIADFRFGDVEKLGNPLAEPYAKTVLNTYDGMVLTFDVYRIKGEESWAKISAAYDDTLRIAEGSLKPEADVQAEIADLNSLTREWLFKLREADSEILSAVRTDFVSLKQ